MPGYLLPEIPPLPNRLKKTTSSGLPIRLSAGAASPAFSPALEI